MTTTLAGAIESGRGEDITRSVTETFRNARSVRAWADTTLAPALHALREGYEGQKWWYPELVQREMALLEGMRLCEREVSSAEQEGSPVVVVATMKGEPYGGGKDVYANTLSAFGLRVVDAGVHRTPQQLTQAVLDSQADALCICMFASLPSAVMLAGKIPGWLAATAWGKRTKTVLAGYGANRQLSTELGFDGYAGDGAEAARIVQDLCREGGVQEHEGRGGAR